MRPKQKKAKKKEEVKAKKVKGEESIKMVGRLCSGAYDDSQRIRIETINRIRDVVRKIDKGIAFDQVEKKKKEKTFEKAYSDENLPLLLNKLATEKKISRKEHDYIEKTLDIAIGSRKIENEYKKKMMEFISFEPIYVGFLEKVRGIGPVLSANLIKNLEYCERFDTVSKLWSYSGLSVVQGEAVRRKKGEQVRYSPFLKTLMWKVGDCLVKSNKGTLRKIYDVEKARQMKRLETEKGDGGTVPKSKMQTHLRAMRKVEKIFLACYWEKSRMIVGLPVENPYVLDKFPKHTHKVGWKDVIG